MEDCVCVLCVGVTRVYSIYAGSKAVDCLMTSKWTAMPHTEDDYTPYFATRNDAIAYCVR